MKKDILKITDEIEKFNWFNNFSSSKEINLPKYNSKVVESFDTFKDDINSIDWENITLEAKNNLRVYLREKRVKHSDDYNKVVKEIKANMCFVDDLSKNFFDKHSFDVKSNLQWDILHYCVERYYLNFSKHIPLFFHDLIAIYENGNIPCGYESEKEFDFSSDGTVLYY